MAIAFADTAGKNKQRSRHAAMQHQHPGPCSKQEARNRAFCKTGQRVLKPQSQALPQNRLQNRARDPTGAQNALGRPRHLRSGGAALLDEVHHQANQHGVDNALFCKITLEAVETGLKGVKTILEVLMLEAHLLDPKTERRERARTLNIMAQRSQKIVMAQSQVVKTMTKGIQLGPDMVDVGLSRRPLPGGAPWRAAAIESFSRSCRGPRTRTLKKLLLHMLKESLLFITEQLHSRSHTRGP